MDKTNLDNKKAVNKYLKLTIIFYEEEPKPGTW